MKCPSCAAVIDDAAKECLGCGIILSKWHATRTDPPAQDAFGAPPTAVADEAGSGVSWLLWPLLAVAAVGFLIWRSQTPHIQGQPGERWTEIGEQDFDEQVLHSLRPALVFFVSQNIADPHLLYEPVIFSLQAKYSKRLKIVHVYVTAKLAETYQIPNEDVVDVILFKYGREVKRSAFKAIVEQAGMRYFDAFQSKLDAEAKNVHNTAEEAALRAKLSLQSGDVSKTKEFREDIEMELQAFIEPL